MNTPTNLTSPKIREHAIRYAIPIYLLEGETAQYIIDKFKGDLVATIQFLRERHFKNMEAEENKLKPAVKNKSPKKTKQVPKSNSQNSLF